jgi:uncharacterized protein with NRDE domain
MCVILFAAMAHPHFPLIVAANRDEAYTRPAEPAAFWQDHPNVYAGRDLEHGGTWLGISRSGRFAAITNYRQGPHYGHAPRSRGELTRDYLTGASSTNEYLRSVEERGAAYRGYSLIAGTPERLYFYSNRGKGVQAIMPGVHGLSNRLLDEPWPKVERGVSVLSRVLSAPERDIADTLFELLADRTPAPDHLLPSTGIALERERALSAAFIAGETYGTRASTVLIVNADGDALFCERTFGPRGAPLASSEQRFRIDCGTRAASDRTARA